MSGQRRYPPELRERAIQMYRSAPTPASLPHAFVISILLLIVFTVAVAVLVQFLTRPAAKAAAAAPAAGKA